MSGTNSGKCLFRIGMNPPGIRNHRREMLAGITDEVPGLAIPVSLNFRTREHVAGLGLSSDHYLLPSLPSTPFDLRKT